MPEHLKHKKVYIPAIAGAALIVAVIVMIFNMHGNIQDMEDQSASLSSKLDRLERQIDEKQARKDEAKSKAIEEATGIDRARVDNDEAVAEDFFTAAFSWKSGDDYQTAREKYQEVLGDDNSFTNTYLIKPTTIETNDGELSYIDSKNLKSDMEDFQAVPLSQGSHNRVRYLAFVHYYVYEETSDLVDKSALDGSEAIIEFVASGSRDEGERRIREVKAWSGFGAALGDS